MSTSNESRHYNIRRQRNETWLYFPNDKRRSSSSSNVAFFGHVVIIVIMRKVLSLGRRRTETILGGIGERQYGTKMSVKSCTGTWIGCSSCVYSVQQKMLFATYVRLCKKSPCFVCYVSQITPLLFIIKSPPHQPHTHHMDHNHHHDRFRNLEHHRHRGLGPIIL